MSPIHASNHLAELDRYEQLDRAASLAALEAQVHKAPNDVHLRRRCAELLGLGAQLPRELREVPSQHVRLYGPLPYRLRVCADRGWSRLDDAMEQAVELLRSPWMRFLVSLELDSTHQPWRAFVDLTAALSESKSLPSLRRVVADRGVFLQLPQTEMSGLLARAPRLRDLVLRAPSVTLEAFRHEHLTHLDLSYCHIEPADTAALLRSRAPRLRSLAFTPSDASVLAPLLCGIGFARLTHLSLAGATGVNDLLTSLVGPSPLRTLDLRHTDLDRRGLAALKTRPDAFPALRTLLVECTQVEDAARHDDKLGRIVGGRIVGGRPHRP